MSERSRYAQQFVQARAGGGVLQQHGFVGQILGNRKTRQCRFVKTAQQQLALAG